MSLFHYTLRQARRLVVFVVGMTVLLFGIALLFLPGPAIVVIPLGLLILSTEFVWAKNFLHRVKNMAQFKRHEKKDEEEK